MTVGWVAVFAADDGVGVVPMPFPWDGDDGCLAGDDGFARGALKQPRGLFRSCFG